jgi:hypothetical protein
MPRFAMVLALVIVPATADVVSAQTAWPFGQQLLAPRTGDQKTPWILRGEATLLPTLDAAAPAVVVVARPAPAPRQAIDCAMVKPVDPAFRSNMPIVTPDPKVNHTMRVIPVPSCREQTEAGGASGR